MKQLSDEQREEMFDKFWDTHTSKNCPFCGSSHVNIFERYGKRYYYYIQCQICYGSGGSSSDMEIALTRWNNRPE
jgi:Lar family restriction alleviation protein